MSIGELAFFASLDSVRSVAERSTGILILGGGWVKLADSAINRMY
jgi:hypothetical protein